MIKHQEYLLRQKKLIELIPNDSLVIVFAASEVIRNGDAHYKFRQNSNFLYLTGFLEPDAVFIMHKKNITEYRSIIFCNPRDPKIEQWTGARIGPEGAKHAFGFNEAYSLSALSENLNTLISESEALLYPFDIANKHLILLQEKLNTCKKNSRKKTFSANIILDLNEFIGEMRLIKSHDEIHIMRKAAEISVAAHRRAMSKCKSFVWEYQFEAELLYEFYKQGSQNPAYNSIIAAGANSCVLHYTKNNHKIEKNQLVLIDAACEFQNYAADITRTFPASGYFTSKQKLIYELVLEAQKNAIALIKPGLPWDQLQKEIINTIVRGLLDLKILHGQHEQIIEKQTYLPYYMHSSGHWLGLDVHDSGKYWLNTSPRKLEPGMVLTVEPGLYLSSSITDLEECWYNIGVRIEDDILVTPDGYEILSAGLPKNIDEIECLING